MIFRSRCSVLRTGLSSRESRITAANESSEISVRIKIDIVEQPCKVTALHHIGNYGGLGGTFFLPQTERGHVPQIACLAIMCFRRPAPFLYKCKGRVRTLQTYCTLLAAVRMLKIPSSATERGHVPQIACLAIMCFRRPAPFLYKCKGRVRTLQTYCTLLARQSYNFYGSSRCHSHGQSCTFSMLDRGGRTFISTSCMI
eukprot:sb/3470733/